jgi:hypothetical protein
MTHNQRKGVKHTDRKYVVLMLSAVVISATLGVTALTAYAANNGGSSAKPGLWGPGLGFRGGGRMLGGWGCGVEVSEAYNETVISIARSDQDVQNLLAQGYSITAVTPIVKFTVEADDSVVAKATNAIVILKKDTTARAAVWVDLDAKKATRIVTFTTTVTEK